MDPSDAPPPALRRNGDFTRLWTGGAVSGFGSAVSGIAYPLLALGVTSSAAQAGLPGLVALASAALVRLPAGVLVDRAPIRLVLVLTDVVRVLTTAALAVLVLREQLALAHLLVLAALNACAAASADVAHSVALRHVVPPAQLPRAFALDDGRGHAVALTGQPVGGLLYGVAPALPLLADLVSFAVSAGLSATLRHPMPPAIEPGRRARLRADLVTGCRFLWGEPFLRTLLLAAAGYQLVFAGAVFALVAHLDAIGTRPGALGAVFAVAAVGGILGAVVAPALQARLSPSALVMLMGWTATVAFAALGGTGHPLLAGALLGCVYLTAAPANAVLSAAQVTRTPAHLQGRVMAASFLVAGMAAPLGPPLGGALLDAAGPVVTFVSLAAAGGLLTLTLHRVTARRWG